MSATAPPAGLCAGCVHHRWLASARSRFLRCDLSDRDPRFARYPPLPVLACPGFVAGPARTDADDVGPRGEPG